MITSLEHIQTIPVKDIDEHLFDVDENHRNILHWAAQAGRVDIFQTLYADPEYRKVMGKWLIELDKTGRTPLHYAIEREVSHAYREPNFSVLSFLLDNLNQDVLHIAMKTESDHEHSMMTLNLPLDLNTVLKLLEVKYPTGMEREMSHALSELPSILESAYGLIRDHSGQSLLQIAIDNHLPHVALALVNGASNDNVAILCTGVAVPKDAYELPRSKGTERKSSKKYSFMNSKSVATRYDYSHDKHHIDFEDKQGMTALDYCMKTGNERLYSLLSSIRNPNNTYVNTLINEYCRVLDNTEMNSFEKNTLFQSLKMAILDAAKDLNAQDMVDLSATHYAVLHDLYIDWMSESTVNQREHEEGQNESNDRSSPSINVHSASKPVLEHESPDWKTARFIHNMNKSQEQRFAHPERYEGELHLAPSTHHDQGNKR